VKEFSAFRPHKKWEGAKRWKEGGAEVMSLNPIEA